MTKIIVTDLDRAAAFYEAVCEFKETGRFSAGSVKEVIMKSKEGAGATLILLADGTSPGTGEAILVFETEDLAGFADRVRRNGGTMTQAPTPVEQLGLSYAMFTDPEGHVVEAVQPDS